MKETKEKTVQASNVQENTESQGATVQPSGIIPQSNTLVPAKVVLPGGIKFNVDLIQKQIHDLTAIGGRVKKIAMENEARIDSFFQKEQLDRAQKSGKVLSVPRAKSDLDGVLAKAGLPSSTKLAILCKLNGADGQPLVSSKDAAKLKALMGFSEALYALVNA